MAVSLLRGRLAQLSSADEAMSMRRCSSARVHKLLRDLLFEVEFRIKLLQLTSTPFEMP